MTNAKYGLVGLALSTLLLAGCTGVDPFGIPSDNHAADDPGAGGPSEPCIVGVWSLDVGDYEAQSIVYINSLAVPMEDFTMTGSESLSVTADGLFRLDTNISTGGAMVLDSYERVYATTTTGYSTAEWSAGEAGTINLENWVDELESTGDAPEETGFGGGVGFANIPTVSMTCVGDQLSLNGPDLPLVSHWTRQ